MSSITTGGIYREEDNRTSDMLVFRIVKEQTHLLFGREFCPLDAKSLSHPVYHWPPIVSCANETLAKIVSISARGL